MKPENKEKVLVLLDSHAILHRGYHALPEFTTSSGEPTGALYGLSLMLVSLIDKFKPDYIVATFDLPDKTHRHKVYKDYKAGRQKTDQALINQIVQAPELFKAFDIPLYDKAGFEADDMLGTIAEELKGKPIRVIIASGDMDTLQLVDGKRVQVYTLKKGLKDTVLYDEDAVRARFNFGPELIPDYKGLRGDPSDNIIGVKGVGEKTATTLITNFGTLEEMYKTLESKGGDEKFIKVGVSERMIGLLKEHKDEALFSKMLATITRDAPITFKLPEKTIGESISIDKVQAYFKTVEFRTLGEKVKQSLLKIGGQVVEAESDSQSDKDSSKKEAPKKKVAKKKKEEGDGPEGTSKNMFGEAGLRISPEYEKAALALWVLDSNYSNPTVDDILEYAKAETASQALSSLEDRVRVNNLDRVYRDIELPLIPIVKEMEDKGVKIDCDYLKELSVEYHKKLSEIEKQIWKLAGVEFNVASPKQLGEILFDTLALTAKGLKKTAGGARSTKESELEKLKDSHPIIPLVLEHRELSKLLGTYIDTMPTQVDDNNRLHARFLQAGSATGRMASQSPNLQNIPIKTDLGRVIRNAFIAEKGNVLVALDYSQIELRIAAVLSGDKKMIKIFKDGEDVHAAVASQVFNVAIKDVTSEMRRKAKVINFGILYGMGVNALRLNLGGTRDEAKQFYDVYFKEFTELADYLENVKAGVVKTGFTETLFGRRRFFPGIKSPLPFIRASAERMAINAPIQGTATGDIIKIAMFRVDEYLKKESLKDKVSLILQVHDELVYEINEKVVKEVVPEIKKIMEGVLTKEQSKGVPILANSGEGKNWGSLKKML